jgi:murein DD-endopeptidase MepM/ murein hydrolase activator NlpD
VTPQPALLERPGTDHEPAAPVIPAPRPAVVLRPAAAPSEAASPEALPEAPSSGAASSEAAEPVRRRSLPRPPGKRGPLWLAALVVGAVVAALPTTLGGQATDVAVSAAEYGLGTASDIGLTGDMEDAGVRRGITEAEAQARLGELAASRAARTPRTVLPTPGRLTTCFCQRWGTMHYGIDLAAPLGTPIVAATDGVVIRAGRASGYGNAVYIQDADGNVHIYGHMRYYSVSAGDLVHAGDQIAKVGNEGQSTGPHLHYEIHRGGMTGRPIDPQDFLAERGVSV